MGRSTIGLLTRRRFMLGVLGGLGAVIGVAYTGTILRYMYPSAGNTTPALRVRLGPDGVIDPQTGATLAFTNGVAGPFYYPTTTDHSVVVGVYVGKRDAHGPLTAENLQVIEETCTHLGCPVAWAPGDNRFECPCHGSQFTRERAVFHGPASQPLWAHAFTLEPDAITIRGRA